jgi:hypothetical protein
MRITKLRKQIPVSLALIALSILAVPAVKAQCGASARKGTALAPELKSLQEPAAQNEEDLSDRAGSPEALTEEKNDSDNLTSPGVSPRGFILMVRQREPELLPDSNTRFRCRSEAVYEGQATLSEVEARQRHAPRGNISTV